MFLRGCGNVIVGRCCEIYYLSMRIIDIQEDKNLSIF